MLLVIAKVSTRCNHVIYDNISRLIRGKKLFPTSSSPTEQTARSLKSPHPRKTFENRVHQWKKAAADTQTATSGLKLPGTGSGAFGDDSGTLSRRKWNGDVLIIYHPVSDEVSFPIVYSPCAKCVEIVRRVCLCAVRRSGSVYMQFPIFLLKFIRIGMYIRHCNCWHIDRYMFHFRYWQPLPISILHRKTSNDPFIGWTIFISIKCMKVDTTLCTIKITNKC